MNTFFMIVWTTWSCSWEISIPLGVKLSQRFPLLPAISITWGGANFSIVIEQHNDARSVFPVHVSGGFKPVTTSYFLCPRFGFDAKMMKEPVEPSRLFSGVSSNALYLMMSLIYFQRCAGQIHICCSLTFTVE